MILIHVESKLFSPFIHANLAIWLMMYLILKLNKVNTWKKKNQIVQYFWSVN